MNKNLKIRIVVYSITFVLLITGLIIGIWSNCDFNNKARNDSYMSNELFNSTLGQNSLECIIEEGTSDTYTAWETTIVDGNSDTYDDENHNYQSKFTNFTIKNSSEITISNYKMKLVAKEQMYFLTGWCGTYEFHQFRGDKELSQQIDFSSKPTNLDDYTVEVTKAMNSDDYIITLMPNDYFIYIPTTEGFESIAPSFSVTPGMILLERIGYPVSFESEQLKTSTDTENVVETNYDFDLSFESRNDSWMKIIDINNEGLTVPNFQGETFNIVFGNNSSYRINKFTFKYTCESRIYISQAWNGSVEIHQGNKVAKIPDLRNYNTSDYDLDIIEVGTDKLIELNVGDYFIYYPSDEESNIQSELSRTGGMIIYQQIDDSIKGNVVVTYHFYSALSSNPTFMLFLVALIIFAVTLLFDVALNIAVNRYKRKQAESEKMTEETINTFTGFVDAKDPYTNGHSKRVAHYTKLIAAEMGYNEEEQKRIYYIALLHDIGKVGIPDAILSKPSRLTDEEYEIIKQHPIKGAEILKNYTSIPNVNDGVLYHHERWDGKGYPEGKKGEEIPLDARIIAAADSFDAMNSDRCYRKKLSIDEIANEFKKYSGTQFDPQVAKVVLVLIAYNKIG